MTAPMEELPPIETDRLRFIYEDGSFVITARIDDQTRTFRAELGILKFLTALSEGRSTRITLSPESAELKNEEPQPQTRPATPAVPADPEDVQVTRTVMRTLEILRDGLLALAPIAAESPAPPAPKEAADV